MHHAVMSCRKATHQKNGEPIVHKYNVILLIKKKHLIEQHMLANLVTKVFKGNLLSL